MNQDPPRLLDPASPADAALREVLQRTSASTPGAAQLEALALKVSMATAAHVGASGALEAPSLWAKASVAKLSAALLVAGAAAWLTWSSGPATHARQAEPKAARVPEQAQAVGETSGRVAAPASSSGRGGVTPATQELPRAEPGARTRAAAVELPDAHAGRPRSSIARHKSPPAPAAHAQHSAPVSSGPDTSSAPVIEPKAQADDDDDDDARDEPSSPATAPTELDLLGRAQALLAREPLAALEVTDDHARAYPHGQFAQEREALAIDALRRLGRDQELQARARAFLRRYPASPHRDRIEEWLR